MRKYLIYYSSRAQNRGGELFENRLPDNPRDPCMGQRPPGPVCPVDLCVPIRCGLKWLDLNTMSRNKFINVNTHFVYIFIDINDISVSRVLLLFPSRLQITRVKITKIQAAFSLAHACLCKYNFREQLITKIRNPPLISYNAWNWMIKYNFILYYITSKTNNYFFYTVTDN